MDNDHALDILAALAHATRLGAYRLLVNHEPEGLATGELVEATGLTQSTFSSHLAVLAKAGLVRSERKGRRQIQRANLDTLRQLVDFLANDCCGGRADLCTPLFAGLDRVQRHAGEVVIYHNPDCETSRNALAMIRNAGVEPHVVEYLNTPPSRAMLILLIARAGLTPRQLLREKGTPYAELGLGDAALDDDALIDAMLAHPILINRPLVVTPIGVRLCRPSETVLDILPQPQSAAFAKEDGERVIDAAGRRVLCA